MKNEDKKKMENIRQELQAMMNSKDYKYAGEGDSPYSQEFVSQLYGKGKKKDDSKKDD